MNKQELIEKYKNTLKKSAPFTITSIQGVLEDLQQLDEPQKVTVPQFVADWIEYCKIKKISLAHALYRSDEAENKSVYRWIVECLENQETFARAWLDGYKVEKEKRYLVKAKGVNGYGCYLNKGLLSKEYFFESKAEIGGCRTKHTRKQLEDDDFGWVFDCEGIEIEEVTE